MRRSLAEVTDAQVVQVVALIDRMAERGAADELIAPLRARLSQLRPPRPLRFRRLLFMPLDPVIVPAARFRAGTPTVPRTAVAPFAAAVHAALGPLAAEIDAAVAGHAAQDAETVRRAGGMLWPQAAAIVASAPQPPGWAAAGLPPGLYPALARGIAAVLQQAVTLQAIVAEAAGGLPVDVAAVDATLALAAPAGPEAWGLVLAVLLGRVPDADAVLAQANIWTARQGDPALRGAFEVVSESQLAGLEAPDGAAAEMAASDLPAAAAQMHRIVALLDGLADETAPVARRDRLTAIRQRLDTSCRARFANGLAAEFLVPLHELLQVPEPKGLQRLATTARQLRALETGARRLGSASTYDALLRQTAVVVRNAAPNAGLAPVEKARLIEILTGP